VIKPVLKWILAGIMGVVAVVLILSLFTMLAVPAREWLTGYFAGYFSSGPQDLPVVTLPGDQEGSDEDWGTPLAELPHCQFRISGRVTQNDGAPIENAEVKIYNTGIFESGAYRFTNKNGVFSYSEIGIETCDKEHFYIAVSKNGYQPYYVLAEPDAELDISLTFYGSY
jgi:hypothetical protein